jgi:sialate O-acetylesterase
MKKLAFPLVITLLIPFTILAQSPRPWLGKKCAVVLTYDDAMDQHLDNALPVLDSLGLKATFYITAYSTSMQHRFREWKQVPYHGHELGNHTLFHPCMGGPGRTWVPAEYDLKNYTVKRMVDEIRMTNLFLFSLDGKTKRTFAFTCGDMKVGDTSFMTGMESDFVAARAVRNEMHHINEIDLYNMDCYVVNGENGEQLIEWAKKAMETNSLLVVLFHGVGGGNALNVSIPAHREFLIFLKQHEKEIMIAPLIEVSNHIRSWQTANTTRK